jgi:acyl-[acyl-carrier-protein]-phospholipid O-acyltransferase/long-chain-fatty-acid--[acyl-carrier-protein] ligase
LLFVALALFGIVAALFGPVKYAVLPDQLQVSELASGNALVEGATFMAILIGTIAGGMFVAGASHMGWICLAVVGLSILSWAFAARIPVSQPSAPDLAITANPWTSTVHLLKTLYAAPRLWDGMVIVSWFWMVGAIVLSLLPALVKGGVGYWLLQSQSLVDFVLIKNIVVISLTVCAVAVTVRASTYVGRREGLMGTAARGGS